MLKYKTSDYIDWFLELGFKAVKVFLRHGPDEGLEGLNKNVEIVANTRKQIGPDIELAVDSWMSSNIECAVRVSEGLNPYNIKWLDVYTHMLLTLMPWDIKDTAWILIILFM